MPSKREFFYKDKFHPDDIGKIYTDENPQWEKVLITSWDYNDYIETFMKSQRLNPAFRMTEHLEDDVCQQSAPSKILQLFIEPGLPFEIPCYSCSKTSTESVNNYYLLTHRDFYEYNFTSRLEKYTGINNKLPVVPALLKTLHDAIIAKDIEDGNTIIQSISRATTGQLQISPLNEFLRKLTDKENNVTVMLNQIQAVKHGATFQCVQDNNGILKATDVVVNVDSLVRDTDFFTDTYRIYEIWNSTWNLKEMSKNISRDYNIKLDINWEPFSCCSACCCSQTICKSRATENKCKRIYSVKIRKGYLSLKWDNTKKPIKLEKIFGQANNEKNRLNRILTIEPYTSTGIPLYSSLIPAVLRDSIHKHLTLKFFNKTYEGVGLFIQQESCQSNPQKLNCFELAKCLGIKVSEEQNTKNSTDIEASDPCIDKAFKLLVIDQDFMDFNVESKKNYRLMVDDTVYQLDGKVEWKIQNRLVPTYDWTKSCDQQGQATHPHTFHLLLTDLSEKELRIKVFATLGSGKLITVRFNGIHEGEVDASTIKMVLTWSIILAGFFLLLGGFVMIMRTIRIKRTKEMLKNKTTTSRQKRLV